MADKKKPDRPDEAATPAPRGKTARRSTPAGPASAADAAGTAVPPTPTRTSKPAASTAAPPVDTATGAPVTDQSLPAAAASNPDLPSASTTAQIPDPTAAITPASPVKRTRVRKAAPEPVAAQATPADIPEPAEPVAAQAAAATPDGTDPAPTTQSALRAAPGGGTSIDSPAAVATGTPAPPDAAAPSCAAPEAAAEPEAEPEPAAAVAVPQVGPELVPFEAIPVSAPAPVTGVARSGMFHVQDGGDTSGYGGLVVQPYSPAPAERPYGGYFDEVADALLAAMAERSIPETAIQQVTVANGEMTCYLDRIHLTAMLWAVRDDPSLRFELMSSLSGVDYGVDVPRRLHVTYELTSMTYRRRIRLEVAVDVTDPYVPSAVPVYPTADWHEREAWDMFGIIFSGHPALTRILMPDDWDGHPQRKDYPLGGIPVEYKGAEIAPPDQRRAYT